MRSAKSKLTKKYQATTDAPNPSRDSDRGALLLAAKWFFNHAVKLDTITRIALIGSICNDKKHPKDIDILVTIVPGADIDPIATLKRKMAGRIQRGLLGADVFLMEQGQYLGRPCSYREPHPRVACSAGGLRCDFDRPFRCDTSLAFTLKHELLTAPPIVLYPEFHATVQIPDDVRAVFNL